MDRIFQRIGAKRPLSEDEECSENSWMGVGDDDTTSHLCQDALVGAGTEPSLLDRATAFVFPVNKDDIKEKLQTLRKIIMQTLGMIPSDRVLFGPPQEASEARAAFDRTSRQIYEGMDTLIDAAGQSEGRAIRRDQQQSELAIDIARDIEARTAESIGKVMEKIDAIMGKAGKDSTRADPSQTNKQSRADALLNQSKKSLAQEDVDAILRELVETRAKLSRMHSDVDAAESRKANQGNALLLVLKQWVGNARSIGAPEASALFTCLTALENFHAWLQRNPWNPETLDGFLDSIQKYADDLFRGKVEWDDATAERLSEESETKKQNELDHLMRTHDCKKSIKIHAWSPDTWWPVVDITLFPFVRQLQGSTNLARTFFVRSDKTPAFNDPKLLRAIIRTNLSLWHPAAQSGMDAALIGAISTAQRMLVQATPEFSEHMYPLMPEIDPPVEVDEGDYPKPRNVTFRNVLEAGGCTKYRVVMAVDEIRDGATWKDVGDAIGEYGLAKDNDRRLAWADALIDKIARACLRITRVERVDPLALWIFHRDSIENELEDKAIEIVPLKNMLAQLDGQVKLWQEVHTAIKDLVMESMESISHVYAEELTDRLSFDSPSVFRGGMGANAFADVFQDLVSVQMRINQLITPKSVESAIDLRRRLRALETARSVVLCTWRRRVSELPPPPLPDMPTRVAKTTAQEIAEVSKLLGDESDRALREFTIGVVAREVEERDKKKKSWTADGAKQWFNAAWKRADALRGAAKRGRDALGDAALRAAGGAAARLVLYAGDPSYAADDVRDAARRGREAIGDAVETLHDIEPMAVMGARRW